MNETFSSPIKHTRTRFLSLFKDITEVDPVVEKQVGIARHDGRRVDHGRYLGVIAEEPSALPLHKRRVVAAAQRTALILKREIVSVVILSWEVGATHYDSVEVI